MKVTLVSTWRIVNSSGGAERIYCRLANALAERGHCVTCVCFDFEEGRPAFPLDDKIKFVNAGIGRKPPFYLSKIVRNLWGALSLSRARRREKRLLMEMAFLGAPLVLAVQRSKPDVVVTFRAEDTFAICDYGKMTVPVVTMSHNATEVFLPEYSAECLKKAVEESAAVQVLLPNFADEVRKLLPRANVVVIPNPVPQFDEVANRSSHEIINVGRITRQKHQDLLVEAFALLAEKYPDWNVKIWGENKEEPQLVDALKRLINDRGLANRIFLCGTTDDIKNELRKASIFAFPSRWEGFSLALTEAMSMGLPSVGTVHCPSVNELIRNNDNGLLAEEDPRLYAAALEKLIKNESLRIQFGNRAKLDMVRYGPNEVWGRWENLLQSVVMDAKSVSSKR